MIQLVTTDEFDEWLDALRDPIAKAKIAIRIDRLSQGNPGDVKPVGNGISELRIRTGPGYRVYFRQRGDEWIILLCAGDKSTQRKDIEIAHQLDEAYEV